MSGGHFGGLCGAAEERTHERDGGEDDGETGLYAAEDVGEGDGVGDVGKVHGGEDGDAEGADDACSGSGRGWS